MENFIKNYPDIISDYSQLINFSFDEIFSYFKKEIKSFESEYYILINPNSSLLFLNNKLGVKNKMIEEILNIAFNLKTKHPSSKIKMFTYKKYVKEITEINEEDDIDMERDRIYDLIIKEVDSTIKTDIIASLSNLYTKIEKSLKNVKNKNPKILKIILINNETEKYKNLNEKTFEDEKLKNVLNEFINEKLNYFGVELKYLDNVGNLLKQKNNLFEKISDCPLEQESLIKSIYTSDEFLKKSEKMSMNLYKKWIEIMNNEEIINAIEKVDEVLLLYMDIMNCILCMKYKANKNEKYRDSYINKINYYLSPENLNGKRNEIIPSDFMESFVEEININKKNINEVNLDNFIKQLNDNQRYNNCICWKKIADYLVNEQNNILRFLDMLQNSSQLMELFEKEIVQKAQEIISNVKNEDDEQDSDS